MKSGSSMELEVGREEASALGRCIQEAAAHGEVDRQRLEDEFREGCGTLFRPLWRSLERGPEGGYFVHGALSGNDALAFLAPEGVHAPEDLHNGGTSSRIQAGGEDWSIRFFPFRSADHQNIRAYVHRVAPYCLPRPQRDLPAIAAGNRHPEISLPAVFKGYRRIWESRGLNLASTAQLSATREMTTEEALAARDGENPTAAGHTRVSIRHLYHCGLWAAARHGWRQGWTAEADHFIITGATRDEIARSVEATKEAIRHASGFTKFTTDTSRLFELEADTRHPAAWSDAVVEERFQQNLPADVRRWVLNEFSRAFPIGEREYRFDAGTIRRLAVKFGRSLLLNEQLYDYIREQKASSAPSADFDFEPSVDEAATLTTPEELLFYMHWLAARGRAAQLVPPNLGFKKRQAYPESLDSTAEGVGLRPYAEHHLWPDLVPRVERRYDGKPLEELAARVSELADVARFFDATLSIHSGSGKQEAVLEQIGRATRGRVNYKISGELQLQLFDVLSGLHPVSPLRRLYSRMVARCEEFAAAGAFGAESALARHYRHQGLGEYLGDSGKGRVDANLFLVFWLGNIVGSRDTGGPGGDHRFFKEKLDELPDHAIREAQRRNTEYIVWLAGALFGGA